MFPRKKKAGSVELTPRQLQRALKLPLNKILKLPLSKVLRLRIEKILKLRIRRG